MSDISLDKKEKALLKECLENEIALFDKKNRKIKISDCIVIGGSNQNIKNIFNN